MVKLTYIGKQATGKVTYPGGSIDVVRGHAYNVSEEVSKHLLKTTQWKKSIEENVKVEEKSEVKKSNKSSKY